MNKHDVKKKITCSPQNNTNMSINNPNVCATKLRSVCMPLLRVICQFHQVSSILRGVNISYMLCKIAIWCQFGLNCGGFKRPGALGAYVTSIKFAEFCSKRFFTKALYVCEPPPPFSSFKICKYRVCVLFIYLLNYVFIYLFIYFCLFVWLFAKRMFGICHPYLFLHPSENIVLLRCFYPI